MKRIFLFLATNLAVILVMSDCAVAFGRQPLSVRHRTESGQFARFFAGGRFYRIDHFTFDQQADGEMVNWCTRHYDTCEFDGKLASLNGRQIVP